MGLISPVATDSNGKAVTAESQSTLGKDDFLELLITKLTHQDPLDPLDDEAFVAQLAQFSSLEQLQNINSSLDESLSWDYLQMQTINNTMATGLIGKEVEATYNGVYLDSDNWPNISYETVEFAENVKIEITDADGNVVRTISKDDIPAGRNSVQWDGLDSNGDRMGEGYYYISISATDANGDSFTPSNYLRGKVEGIIYRDGSAYLQVDGVEVPLSEISSIHEYVAAETDEDE